MLRLVHVLYGLQPKVTRAMPQLPPTWQDFGFAEVVSRLEDAGPGKLYAGKATGALPELAARGAAGALAHRDTVETLREALDNSGRPWALVEPSEGESFHGLAPDSFLIISVDDPLMALQRLAVYHRRQLAPTVVGFSGSASATSTLEVTAALLGRRFRTLTSEPRLGYEVRVPITLLQLTSEHEALLIELGIGGPGELRFAAQLAQPRIGIVTTHDHGREAEHALHAAGALVESLPPTGVAILNADNQAVAALSERSVARVVRYGLSDQADLRATNVVSNGINGMTLLIHSGVETLRLSLPLFGNHSVHVALAAIACGQAMGMSWEEIVAGLNPPDAQLRLLVLPGPNGSQLIDDTYGTNTESTVAALNLLSKLDGDAVAVLGPIIEPDMAVDAVNRLVGLRVAESVYRLVCVGEATQGLAEAARQAGMAADRVHEVADPGQAIALLEQLLNDDDYVLIKGDQLLAPIVTALQRYPQEGSQ
jgi:UDP-N-acetylmuramoyl-tripeptide--D-alanyl-D-alanine ligase